MIAYLLRRLLLTIPTLLGITLIVFTLTRFVPGGPIEKMMTDAQFAGGEGAHIVRDRANSSGSLDEEQLAELKTYYGFDKPLLISYAEWLWRVLQLDLGYSTRYGEPVWDTIVSRMPLSLFYGGLSLLITYAVCIPLGIAKALRHNSRFDHLSAALIFLNFLFITMMFSSKPKYNRP
jgi:microcin C transport system permease protein